MNSGLICISVCAMDAEALFEKANSASAMSDFVELRLDCLDLTDPQELKFTPSKKFILTLRSLDQGGTRHFTPLQRQQFWRSVPDKFAADVELDVIADAVSRGFDPTICSHHCFSASPTDLIEIYDQLSSSGADVLKIAVSAGDVVDAIEVWNLLEIARHDGRPLIPIAMGEAGKWTRILGLAHGAHMTYAALEAGDETAPGQITISESNDVYHVKELDRSTDVYGIIGGDTGYSMSPYIHNAAFRSAKMNAVFVPLQVKDLDAFVRRMVRPETREVELNFRGFSVTNPHKMSIMKHLDHIDEAAKAIGAVNTVKVVDEKLYGYNTDADGFLKPLKDRVGDLRGLRVAVAGAGGAARACLYSLAREGADISLFARDEVKAMALSNEIEAGFEKLPAGRAGAFDNFDIVVNTTPLGTRGELETSTIAVAEQLKNVKLVYDLVYNPPATRLLREALAAGAVTLGGFDMLIEQARRQFEIWTGRTPPSSIMAAAARKALNES